MAELVFLANFYRIKNQFFENGLEERRTDKRQQYLTIANVV